MQKPKQSRTTETTLQAQNAISTNATSAGLSLGDLTGLSYPIHPNNFRLFPNLQGIWRSFQQYKMGQTQITCQPLASTLASGAYSCTLVPSTQSNVGFFVPAFSTLINYATTAVSTIWKPMIYKFTGNILHRLGSYLMQSGDDSTSSPGTLMISKSQSVGSNQQNDIMPIFTLKSSIHLKDFVPAAPQPSPIQAGIFGIYYYPVVTAGVLFTAGNYKAIQSTLTPDFSVGSSTYPNNWMRIRQTGNITMCITYTGISWSASALFADGVQLKPIAFQTGKNGAQYVYTFYSSGNCLISSTTGKSFSNNVLQLPQSLNISFFRQHTSPSLGRNLQRWRIHSLKFTQMLAQFSQIIRPAITAQRIQTRQRTQVMQIQGYCWLISLKHLGVKVQDLVDQQLGLSYNLTSINTPDVPFIDSRVFLNILFDLGLYEKFIESFTIQDPQLPVSHIVAGYSPNTVRNLLKSTSLGAHWLDVLQHTGYIVQHNSRVARIHHSPKNLQVTLDVLKPLKWSTFCALFQIDPAFYCCKHVQGRSKLFMIYHMGQQGYFTLNPNDILY